MIEITEEVKIELITLAISTEEGWKALAQSLQGKPKEIKEECINLLSKIGGQRQIDVPMPNGGTISVDLSDMLVRQLERYISQLSIEFV